MILQSPIARGALASLAALLVGNFVWHTFMDDVVVQQGRASQTAGGQSRTWLFSVIRSGLRYRAEVVSPGGSVTKLGPFKKQPDAFAAAQESALMAAQEWAESRGGGPPLIGTETAPGMPDPVVPKPPGITNFLANNP